MIGDLTQREDEIETALETGILAFNVESLEELDAFVASVVEELTSSR